MIFGYQYFTVDSFWKKKKTTTLVKETIAAFTDTVPAVLEFNAK